MAQVTKLSIILPVYNEEKNIPLIGKKFASLKTTDVELILVEDGGSSDKTRQAVEKLSAKHPSVRPLFTNTKGYGHSILAGLKAAQGEYVCWTHADLQTDLADTLRAYQLILEQDQPKRTFIKGKRYGRPAFDVFFTFGMSILETVVLKTPLFDINAQPNLVHRSFVNKLKNAPGDFSFDLFAYYTARKQGYKIVRFPVHFGKRLFGQSHWNTGLVARWKFIKRTLDFTWKLQDRVR